MFFRYFLSCFTYFIFVRVAEFPLFPLHYSSLLFLAVPSFFAHFWMFTVTVYIFSCCIFCRLHHCHVTLFCKVIFSCCTFFRVALFLCIALFHVALLHAAVFSFCIFLLLLYLHVAIFLVTLCSLCSCCTISRGVARISTNIYDGELCNKN